MKLLELFYSFVEIGLFSIGGGYAAIPLIRAQVVEKYAWLTLSEFTDLVTIAEMTPGPIAVNSATFVGIRLAGLPGAVIATAGCILPGCAVALLLSALCRRYGQSRGLQTVLGTLRPAMVALIAGASLSIFWSVIGGAGLQWQDWQAFPWVKLALLAGAFALLRSKKVGPILTMALTGVLYLGVQLASGALVL